MKSSIYIIKAAHDKAYRLSLTFSDGNHKIIDFTKAFASLSGDYARYNSSSAFKKWKLKDGNISWGADEAIIFKVGDLYKGKVPVAKPIAKDNFDHIRLMAEKA